MLDLLLSRILFPELFSLRFPHGGIGIRKRASQFEPFWREHLEKSRERISEWVEESESTTVLGAGTLLDLPLDRLKSKQIQLIDGDPTLAKFWSPLKRKFPSLSFEIKELSGDLLPWREKELRSLSCPTGAEHWASALKLVRERPPREIPLLPETGTVISLNLLSQIPLTWQMIVEQELKRIFGAEWIERHEESWLLAARVGGAELVARHLSSLRGAKRVLILTDLEYLFYRGASESPVLELPLDWSSDGESSGEWTANARSESFSFELMPALCGVEITDREQLSRLFPDHRISYGPPWLWHLLPWGHNDPARSGAQSGERRPSGEVHLVGSILLEKTSI